MPEKIKQTPLYLEHVALGAKIVPFGGWHMPLQYDGILAEHAHCRTKASLFDICHMGEFIIEGGCRESGLDALVTQRIIDMPVKTCRYGCMLTDEGDVIDDLILFRIEQDKWMMVVNGATIEKDERHLRSRLQKAARYENVSNQLGKLDIQGPLAREVMKNLAPGIEKLRYYTFDYFPILGENVIVSRTGYTGELGYEIYFPANRIIELWRLLLRDDRVRPAGLGARDVLRLEMGYNLYGQDIDETISPLEAGLQSFVDLEKDFIGRDALLKIKDSNSARTMIFFTSDTRRAPRHGHALHNADGQKIGVVTSGTYSPAVQRGIGMGLVSRAVALDNGVISFGNGAARNDAHLAQRPFYKKGSLKG